MRYRVSVEILGTSSVDVEADNPQEALEKAKAAVEDPGQPGVNDDVPEWDWPTAKVEECRVPREIWEGLGGGQKWTLLKALDRGEVTISRSLRKNGLLQRTVCGPLCTLTPLGRAVAEFGRAQS